MMSQCQLFIPHTVKVSVAINCPKCVGSNNAVSGKGKTWPMALLYVRMGTVGLEAGSVLILYGEKSTQHCYVYCWTLDSLMQS